MSKEEIPPSFAPQNRKNISNNNENPIIVGQNKHIQHSTSKPKTSAQPKQPYKNNTSNKNNIPPSYTPLSQRQTKPSTYSSNNNNARPQINKNNNAQKPIYTSQRKVTPQISQHYSRNQNNNSYPNYQEQNSYNSGEQIANPKKKKTKQKLLAILTIILIIVIAWPSYLFYRANSQLTSIEALSNKATTSQGTTWLIAGSDSREKSHIQDNTQGERSDSIIMVHKAPNGQASMISIPRDTMADIPGYGLDKINASFSYGGPKLLVETVENLTNTKIDHYVQIGMNGVEDLVNAVNGVNLCLDYDVNDANSGLVWKAGCHDADGKTALAFARMRYADPLSDLGRADRQRQVISKLMNKVFTPSILINPMNHIALVDAGSQSVKTDTKTNPYDIGMLALAFRKARNDNITGLPPIESMNYILLSGVSTVLLDTNLKDKFFEKMRQGTLMPDDFQKF